MTGLPQTVTVKSTALERLAAAHDASHYLLTPSSVLVPESAADVAAVFAQARATGATVTFRSGGTSLSGQAVSDSLLVDTRSRFQRLRVGEGGRTVTVEPGVTVRRVNVALARHKAKLGPDPASEIACTIGGVVANNSSGMSCGIEANTYRTLASSVLVLPSGTVVDTAAADADERLHELEPAIHEGLTRLRDRVRGDDASVATLRRLHSIKNTMGYGLNSFLDFDRPVDILQHLVIGSEGTLAFVASATFRTVEVRPFTATALLIFPTLADATRALPALTACGPTAIELMDATSLRVGQRDPGAPEQLRRLEVAEHAALLVEFQERSEDEIQGRLDASADVLAALNLTEPARFSTDRTTAAQLWHVRKGLYTLVAGNRPAGTTALLEDIAVPVERLYDTCSGLIALFEKHGYRDSVIFGHAKDGNIHFMLGERFDDPASLQRYSEFTEEMVALVLGQGGTLKAEHGTGRIMAPYVRAQYGDELYEVMRAVKSLIDPDGLLNPGVLLDDTSDGHLRNLKLNPAVEAEVDRCVECGYCEPVCPSKDLTLTPRQRIVVRRELARAEAAGDEALARELRADYGYEGVETCAVDGMCQTACPVLINTGDLVRRLRAESAPAAPSAVWGAAAKHWGAGGRAIGAALSIAKAMPPRLPQLATSAARAVLGTELVPAYSADLPRGGTSRGGITGSDPAHAEVVYFASCVNTMFAAEGGEGVGGAFLSLCAQAGVAVAVPENPPSLCCGTPWKSKGMRAGYAEMTGLVVDALRKATDGGRLPVVCDASSCTEGLETMLAAVAGSGIRVIDSVEFVAERVLPALGELDMIVSIVVHPTCSSAQLGINGALDEIARRVAREVIVPDDWGCCAFAGDRGMLHPELTASATAREAAEVGRHAADAYASLNRTCELGMTRATGKPYRHILQILDDAVRSGSGRAKSTSPA